MKLFWHTFTQTFLLARPLYKHKYMPKMFYEIDPSLECPELTNTLAYFARASKFYNIDARGRIHKTLFYLNLTNGPKKLE